jgi:hypothetical protein
LTGLVLLQGIPHGAGSAEVGLQTGSLQGGTRVGTHIAGNHRLRPCIYQELSGLDTGAAASCSGLVFHGHELFGCRVSEDKVFAATESLIHLGIEILSCG